MAVTNNGITERPNVRIDSSTVLIPHGEAEYKVDKLFFSAIKEEEWLNLLASHGYALVGRKFTGYIFENNKRAKNHYYSVCLLPAPAESDYASNYMEEKSGHSTLPVCTFLNKAYYKTTIGECSNGVVNDAVRKRKHLMHAFLFNAGLLLFWLCLLCYNLVYWVRFDSANVLANNKYNVWKPHIDFSQLFKNGGKSFFTDSSMSFSSYLSIIIVLVILCIPFTVYYLDQYIYSSRFLKKVRSLWQEK